MKGLIREYHRLKGEGEDEAVLQGIVAKYDLLQQDAPGVDKWQAPTIESSQKSEHQLYLENKSEYQNIRLKSLLEPRTNNDKL